MPVFLRGTNGIILIFSLTDKRSFETLDMQRKEALKVVPDVPMILVGTKKDLVSERQVLKEVPFSSIET